MPRTPVSWSASMISPVEELTAPLLRREVDAGRGPRAGDLRRAARLQPGHLRGVRRRRPGGPTDVLSPGLEQLRVAAALPQLRRHRAAARDVGAGDLPRQRLVPRPAVLERPARLLRRPTGRDRPAGGRLRRRPPPGGRHRRDAGRPGRRRPWPTTSTTGRRSTPGVATTGGGCRGRPLPGGWASRSCRSTCSAWRRTSARPSSVTRPGVPSRSGPRRPGRRWSTSGRTWSAGCGSACAARPARRSPCGTPRCSSTASSASGRCGRRRRPTGSCSAATTTSSSRP